MSMNAFCEMTFLKLWNSDFEVMVVIVDSDSQVFELPQVYLSL